MTRLLALGGVLLVFLTGAGVGSIGTHLWQQHHGVVWRNSGDLHGGEHGSGRDWIRQAHEHLYALHFGAEADRPTRVPARPLGFPELVRMLELDDAQEARIAEILDQRSSETAELHGRLLPQVIEQLDAIHDQIESELSEEQIELLRLVHQQHQSALEHLLLTHRRHRAASRHGHHEPSD